MKRTILTSAVLTGAVLALASSSVSGATVLYGLGVAPITSTPTTITFDRATGEATPVGPLGDPAATPYGLAIANGTFYTFDGTTDRIRTIDPFSGAFTATSIDIGVGNLSGEGDIAFSIDGSIGYLTTANRPGGPATDISPALYTFSLASGTSMLIGTTMDSVGPITIDGLAVSPLNGQIYAITDADDQLYTLNPGTAFLTPVGALGVSPNSAFGALAFDPETNELFGVINDRLYTIDPATGAATAANPMGFGTDFGSISGLAASNVPEPSTAAILALALAGLAARRRRTSTQ